MIMEAQTDTPEEDLIEELADICRAVSIESEHAFQFAGQRFEVQGQGPMPLILCLQQVLYHQAYARRFDYDQPAVLSEPDPRDLAPSTERSFTAALYGIVSNIGSSSNPSEFLDPGWQVVSVLEKGFILAMKNGLNRVFPSGTFSPVGHSLGKPLAVGSSVVVWWSRTSFHDQPGFFYIHSRQIPDDWKPRNLVRLYWNLRAEEAPERLADLVTRLDRFQVPYQLKTLSDPAHYATRSDSTVLYFQRRHYQIVARLALEVATSSGPNAQAEAPLFTHQLGPGLAVAEDPGTSFGMSRCSTLAEGLWNAYFLGHGKTVDGKMEEVRQHFARRGIDLECPHLNPASADIYGAPCLEEGP